MRRFCRGRPFRSENRRELRAHPHRSSRRIGPETRRITVDRILTVTGFRTCRRTTPKASSALPIRRPTKSRATIRRTLLSARIRQSSIKQTKRSIRLPLRPAIRRATLPSRSRSQRCRSRARLGARMSRHRRASFRRQRRQCRQSPRRRLRRQPRPSLLRWCRAWSPRSRPPISLPLRQFRSRSRRWSPRAAPSTGRVARSRRAGDRRRAPRQSFRLESDPRGGIFRSDLDRFGHRARG